MVKYTWPPLDQIVWTLDRESITSCRQDMAVDVAIVGGGMAGLAAAQAFHARGKRVVLCEQYLCGSGASGKSSGFVTPNAELSFTDMSHRYNISAAKEIWDFIISGVDDIRTNIKNHALACEYEERDVLMLANTSGALKTLATECDNLAHAGYQARMYNDQEIQELLGSHAYVGALRTGNSFGMNGYQYCQNIKRVLQKSGIMIFEETPVTAIFGNTIQMPHAKITAEHIVVCTDRFMPNLGLLDKEVYHAQTFVMASEQLTDAQVRALFPQEQFMAWDSELIYNYFRISADQRLILGGGNLFSTYSSKPNHDYAPIVRKLTSYWAKQFPDLAVQFEYVWPGLMGISKDIAPLAGRDAHNPSLYYVSAAAGLAIAAGLGRYSAEHIVDGRTDLDAYFSPYRSFPVGGVLQSILGNKLSFAISNVIKVNIP